MEFQFDGKDLILEVTRKCNLQCKHCLRGEAQNINLDVFAFNNFLYENDINHIGTLTITGGEPLMVPKIIEDMVSNLRWKGVSVNNFYIATNGTYFNNESLKAIESLYFHVEEPEISYIEISNSTYHQEERDRLGLNIEFDMESILENVKIDLVENLKKIFPIEDYQNYDDPIESQYQDINYHIELKYSYLYNLIDLNVEKDHRLYSEKSMYSEGRGLEQGFSKKPDYSIEGLYYYSANNEVILNECDISFDTMKAMSA